VFSMVESLLSSLPAPAAATMVLRLPSWFRGELPFTVKDRRDYGESTVAFLSSADFSGGST